MALAGSRILIFNYRLMETIIYYLKHIILAILIVFLCSIITTCSKPYKIHKQSNPYEISIMTISKEN